VQPTPLPAELRAAIPDITLRLAAILAALAALVARAFLRHPVHAVHIVPLWNYIGRTARRFTRTLDNLAAGRLRPHVPRPRRTPSRARAPLGFPTTRNWLLAELRHEAAGYGLQLTHLLEQPESQAILAAAPQAARVLRPLCRMLGFTPAPIQPPPRPPAAPSLMAKPGRSRRADPDGDLPALGPRPTQPLCPRLLTRWPFNQRPRPAPA
jgi:hypothetical protein